ncbi:unnamed protein product [Euphydryas editha]|uniref:DUF7869 domain-containing protein n=1 Tax=Euphydryas editha TaxID=104508 RepID=A0AAU9UWZ4_EUPED|nr:unnamed protein product [Euphydryas editha]
MKRGQFLVNMVKERDKENITPPIIFTQHANLEYDFKMSSSDVVSSKETVEALSVVDTFIPSTSKQQKYGVSKYYISPIQSDESDIDDSDEDPDFQLVHKSKIPPKVVPPSSSSTSSTGSSSCPCSSKSNSSSDTEDDSEQVDPQNAMVLETSTQNIDIEKKSKKRVRKPLKWKSKVAKQLRNSGKAYLSQSKSKKQVPERKVGPPCGEKCRLKCKDKIDEVSRQQIFDAYWGLGNLERQREFVVRHSQQIKPKYRYSSTQNFRALNTAFYFEVNESKIRVCKPFFKSTLDLSHKAIKTALSKKTESGVIQADFRGRHDNHPTIDPQIKQSVKDFINSIPRIESHYLRAQTTREFISSDKSLADIYRDYKRLRERDELPVATSSTFNRIFNTEFNISFFVPKKDQCDLCERFKNSDDKEKRKLIQEYEEHLKEKTLARTEKENDKNRKDGTVVAVYDLQAVLQIPKGQISLFFYKSRINCLNFTISDLRAKDVICYFWDETEGKRGAVEIGSCILDYIKSQVDQNPNKEIDVIFYSDNCGGQQKNKFLLSAYAYAVNKLTVKSITHKFLIRGHSQNEGDNVHSVIEKQIKRYLQSGPIYIPEQYKTLIVTAKKTGKPYKVVEMTHSKFYDMKALQESWGSNFNIDEEKNQIKWHDIKVLRVEKEHPEAFFYKTSFTEEIYRKACVRKRVLRRRGTGLAIDQSLFSIGLTQAYNEKIALSDAKKKDIQELIDKNVIPKSYYDIYYKYLLDNIDN